MLPLDKQRRPLQAYATARAQPRPAEEAQQRGSQRH
jgi:hypothetical protein